MVGRRDPRPAPRMHRRPTHQLGPYPGPSDPTRRMSLDGSHPDGPAASQTAGPSFMSPPMEPGTQAVQRTPQATVLAGCATIRRSIWRHRQTMVAERSLHTTGDTAASPDSLVRVTSSRAPSPMAARGGARPDPHVAANSRGVRRGTPLRRSGPHAVAGLNHCGITQERANDCFTRNTTRRIRAVCKCFT